MKKSILFLFATFLLLGLTSLKGDDHEGIKFETLTLEQAMKKAQKSGKIIFIDVYTVWCGPCKKMAANSFTNDEVAKLYNKNFINIKIEAEKDADGPEISRKYRVTGYPTLLYIDGEGNVKHSALGYQSPENLITIANNFTE